MSKPLSTHDERQSAYRGEGPDTDPTGHGRDDPSAPMPAQRGEEGWYPRGHGKGGTLGEGQSGGQEKDGSTQPDFGQHPQAAEQASGEGREGGGREPTADDAAHPAGDRAR